MTTKLFRRSIAPRIFQACALSAFFIAPLSPAQGGLVAWWTMDEGTGSVAADSAGSSDAATSNTDWASSVGIIGGRDFGTGLAFDSINDTFVPSNFFLPREAGTISMWVKPNELRRMVFYYQGDAADSMHNGFGYNTTTTPIMEIHTGLRDVPTIDGTKAQFYVTYQDGVSNVGSDHGPGRTTLGSPLMDASSIDGESWYHFVVSWGRHNDDPHLRMYLNGEYVNWTSIYDRQDTWANIEPTISQFGQVPDPASTNRFFNGTVDDIAIWDYQISHASAALLYNGVAPNDSSIVPNPEPGSIVLSALGGVLVWRKARKKKPVAAQDSSL